MLQSLHVDVLYSGCMPLLSLSLLFYFWVVETDTAAETQEVPVWLFFIGHCVFLSVSILF